MYVATTLIVILASLVLNEAGTASDTDIRKMYNKYVVDGKLTMEQAKELGKYYGVNDTVIEVAFSFVDSNRDNSISFDEFKAAVKKAEIA